jgi:hypothetical protein
MSTDTLTLTDFLLARIAEDEGAAQRHGPGASKQGLGDYPARVLAECEAKRRIVDLFPKAAQDGDGWNEAGIQVLEALALPYADHPDYREEWRA